MGKPLIDLTGQVFDRLTVLSRAPARPDDPGAWWHCSCSCGGSVEAKGAALRRKNIRSCGCLIKEKNEWLRTEKPALKHGQSGSEIYDVWSQMWQRCTNPYNPRYERYRNRTPPESWRDFEVFAKDMGPRPEGMTLERVKNDQPYGPDNCVWASWTDQNRNKG